MCYLMLALSKWPLCNEIPSSYYCFFTHIQIWTLVIWNWAYNDRCHYNHIRISKIAHNWLQTLPSQVHVLIYFFDGYKKKLYNIWSNKLYLKNIIYKTHKKLPFCHKLVGLFLNHKPSNLECVFLHPYILFWCFFHKCLKCMHSHKSKKFKETSQQLGP
jgi:hypothetical protein